MSKIILDDVTSLNATSVINSNFDKIEDALQDQVLYRNNPAGEANSMSSNLDMNGKRIYNLPKPETYGEPARLQDVVDLVAGTIELPSAGVTSFNTREGAVVLTSADVTDALGFTPPSNTDSVLIGSPTTTTQLPSDNSNKVATTAYVSSRIDALPAFPTHVTSFNTRSGTVSLTNTDVENALGYTPVNPTTAVLTGNPTAPTQLTADNSTRIATTAYVTAKVAATTAGVSSFNTRTGAVTLSPTDVTSALGYTPPDSVSANLTGSPTAPTPLSTDNSTRLATTAYVTSKIAAGAGVTSFNTRTGAVSLASSDVTTALGYIPVNPNAAALLGTPTAPTQSTADSSTRIATTALVDNKIIASGSSVVTRDTIQKALTGSAATVNWIWNSDIPGAVNADINKNIYIQRKAVYPSGTGLTGAMYIHTFTPNNTTDYTPVGNPGPFEWGLTSEMFSYTNSQGGATQNVALNGTISKLGTGPCWGGNFVAYDRQGQFHANSGATIGSEIDVAGQGTDNWKQTIGIHVAAATATPQNWTPSTSIKQWASRQPFQSVWTPSTAFTTGTYVTISIGGFPYYYRASTGGTSGSTSPAWITAPVGGTLTDGTITWALVATFATSLAYINEGPTGTTGSTQPTWPTTEGATVTDGTITWVARQQAGSLYSGTLVGGGTVTWQYGFNSVYGGGTVASFHTASECSGTFGLLLEGSHVVGIDTSVGSMGTAVRIGANQYLDWNGSSSVRSRYNSSTNAIEFYSGATRKGYISLSGDDVQINKTGPSLSTDNSFTGSQTFNNSTYFYTAPFIGSNMNFGSGSTINWNSGGGNYVFDGTILDTGAYVRCSVDGNIRYFKAYYKP